MKEVSIKQFFDHMDNSIDGIKIIASHHVCSKCRHERRCDKTYRRCDSREDIWNIYRNGLLGALRELFNIPLKGDAPRKLFDFAGKEASRIVKNKHFQKKKDIEIILTMSRQGKLVQPKKIKCRTCGKEVWPSKIYFSKTNQNAGQCYMCLKGEAYILIPKEKKAFKGSEGKRVDIEPVIIPETAESKGINKFLGRLNA